MHVFSQEFNSSYLDIHKYPEPGRWAINIKPANRRYGLNGRARPWQTFDSNSVSVDIKLKAPTHSSRVFFLSICKDRVDLTSRKPYGTDMFSVVWIRPETHVERNSLKTLSARPCVAVSPSNTRAV